MKPAPFEYERAADLKSALSALARFGKQAKVLAGGQSLIPMLNLRLASTERLIDVGRLDELRYIRVVGNELRVGALTTHNAVLRSPEVAEHCPIMVEAYRLVSHHSVRNRGTIGGSLCHNDPASEMPLVVNLRRSDPDRAQSIGRAGHRGGQILQGQLRDRAGCERAAGGNPRADSGQRSRMVVPGGQPAQGGLRAGRRRRDAGDRRRRRLPPGPPRLPQRGRDDLPHAGDRSADRGSGAERRVVLRRCEGRHGLRSTPPPTCMPTRSTVATWSRS